MYGVDYGSKKYRQRGLFGGSNAGASMAPAPIVQGVSRTRDQAQSMGLIGGSAPKGRSYLDELMADPFTTLFLGTQGLDRKYAMQAADQAAAEAAPQRAWMNNYIAGLPDAQRFSAMTNPEEYSKNIAQGFAPQTSTFFDPTQGKWNQKPQDMMTVGKDAAVFNPNTGAPVYRNDAPQEPRYFNTGQAVVSVDPATNKPTVLYQDPQQARGSGARLRPATPEEAARYGPPGTMGQIDDTTGRFYPTARPNPQTGGLPTEGERKFGLYAKTARDALADIEKLEFANGINQASTFDRGGQLNPFDGNSRLYDQAIDRFLDGWSRAMTGAAMTDSEKQFYYGIMKPTFGDDDKVRLQKAQERRAMVERLKEAAARGYTEPQPEVIMPSASDVSDDELRAMLGL